MRRLRLRLRLQPVRGDLVNLPRGCHVHHVVGLHLDLVARWQEGVEAHDEVRVALEELRHTADHPWSVDAGEEREHSVTVPALGQGSSHRTLPLDLAPSSPLTYETMHN